jgi:hypothetical protein
MAARPWSAATNVKGSFGDLTAGQRPRMHFLGEVLLRELRDQLEVSDHER